MARDIDGSSQAPAARERPWVGCRPGGVPGGAPAFAQGRAGGASKSRPPGLREHLAGSPAGRRTTMRARGLSLLVPFVLSACGGGAGGTGGTSGPPPFLPATSTFLAGGAAPARVLTGDFDR